MSEFYDGYLYDVDGLTDDEDYDLITLEDEDYEYGPVTYGEDL